MNRFFTTLILLAVLSSTGTLAQSQTGQPLPAKTFTIPLLPYGPDPWSIYHDGYYYYMHTLIDSIGLWRTKNLSDLKNAEYKTIWKPPVNTPHSKHLWAPEILFLEGKWYVYYAADDGNTDNHRLWVLENASADPFTGKWEMKGKITDATDQWAIDGSVFKHKDKLYLIWSGWEGPKGKEEIQNIYIARLKNPWTVESRRVKLSSPELPWERIWDQPSELKPGNPIFVNEGPEILRHGNKVFLIYSASGCWTNHYALGMLTVSVDSDLLNPASWQKSQQPVFRQSNRNQVYATGHNSFFTSPDGTEDWILYHANSAPNQGCDRTRSPRAQKINWKADGTPDFGEPVAEGVAVPIPSEKARKVN